MRALTLFPSGCRRCGLLLGDAPLLLFFPRRLARAVSPWPRSAFPFPPTQDFFVVCFFLAWLVVALVPHFAYHNEVLLDAWLSLWTLVIQPLLGVLMLGTIVAGTLSYVQSKEEITTM